MNWTYGNNSIRQYHRGRYARIIECSSPHRSLSPLPSPKSLNSLPLVLLSFPSPPFHPPLFLPFFPCLMEVRPGYNPRKIFEFIDARKFSYVKSTPWCSIFLARKLGIFKVSGTRDRVWVKLRHRLIGSLHNLRWVCMTHWSNRKSRINVCMLRVKKRVCIIVVIHIMLPYAWNQQKKYCLDTLGGPNALRPTHGHKRTLIL